MDIIHDNEVPQILKYGKFGRIHYWLALGLAHIHVLLTIFLIFDTRGSDAALVGLLSSAYYAFAFFCVRHKAHLDILLFRNYFIQRNGIAAKQINFSEIASIQTCRISWWNLCKINLQSGKSYVINSSVSGAEHLITNLRLFDESFFKNDDYSKISSIIVRRRRRIQRSSEFIKSFGWHMVTVGLGSAATLSAALTLGQLYTMQIMNPTNYFGDLFLHYSFVFLMAGCSIYSSADYYLEKKERFKSKNFQDVLPDLHLEHRAFRYSLQAFLSFSIIASLVIYTFNLNLVSVTRAGLNIPHINVGKNEWLIIDKRFTTAMGRYPLKRNERISYQRNNSEHLGKIIGLQNDMTTITVQSKSDRSVASTKRVNIPENFIAVQSGVDGLSETLVNMEQINGRITDSFADFFKK